MKLTEKNLQARTAYLEATPKQFGTLHERMKFVMEQMQAAGGGVVPNDLWHAVYDLETEVSYHEPQRPPCGRRA